MVTTFELPGCQDMWTVVGPRKSEQEDEEETEEKTDSVKEGEKEEVSVSSVGK